jgi:DUF971 family protein/molybdopterin converting factor small subunit
MTTDRQDAQPTDIKLHRKSRVLEIAFADGARFYLPCEYLRVYSPSAEVRASTRPEVGKEEVSITRIEPQGTYAVRLFFDDGHDTGIYSWNTLYQLGAQKEENWIRYLQRLEEMGYRRREPGTGRTGAGSAKVSVLYFSYLVDRLGRKSEQLPLPESVRDVRGVLALLRRRGDEYEQFLVEDKVQVTVNKNFAELFTHIEDGDELGIVPVTK